MASHLTCGLRELQAAARSAPKWWTAGLAHLVAYATSPTRRVRSADLGDAVTALLALLSEPAARPAALFVLANLCRLPHRSAVAHAFARGVAGHPGGIEALLGVLEGRAVAEEVAACAFVLAEALSRAGFAAIADLPASLVRRTVHVLDSAMCDLFPAVDGAGAPVPSFFESQGVAEAVQVDAFRALAMLSTHAYGAAELKSTAAARHAVFAATNARSEATRCAAIALLGVSFTCGDTLAAEAARRAGVPQNLVGREALVKGHEAQGLHELLRAEVATRDSACA